MGENASTWEVVAGVVLVVVGVIFSETGVGGYLIVIGIGLIIGGAAGMIAESQAKKAKQAKSPQESTIESGGFLISTMDTQEPVRLIYGLIRVAGNIIYINTTGDNNEILHIVQTVGEGTLDSCVAVYLDTVDIETYTDDIATYYFHDGNPSQTVDTSLQSMCPEWTDPLRHTAYVYVRLKYDATKFNGMPNITVLVKGLKVYDPRSGLTGWSDNPALVWFNLFTNSRYAFGFDSSLVETGSIVDSANWCDDAGSGITYNFNGGVYAQEAALDVIIACQANFRAILIYSAGKYRLKVLDVESAVMGLGEDDIIADSFKISVPGLPETPNRTRIKFVNSANSYNTDDIIVEDLNALTIEGYELENTITLTGTTDWAQAQRLAVYNLERARLNKVYSFAVGQRGLPLEVGDVVSVTHSLPGWSNQQCRIVSMELAPGGIVGLTVIEENDLLYNDVIDINTHTYSSTNLPSPFDPPDSATNLSFIESEYYNKDVSYTKLTITFTNPLSPFWDYCQVWMNLNNEGYTHYADVTGSISIQPVKEQVTYKIKMVSVSRSGIRQNFSSATEWSYNVIGKNTPPPDAQNFKTIPQSDTIILMWDAVNIVDLQGYEIRKGTAWGSGIFIGFTRAITFQINGVAPGTHSYMLKSVDTNGKYSVNYAIATCTVYGPASYTEKMSEYNDFATPAVWQASTAYSLGNKVIPTTANGYYYKCTTAGTSGGTQPTWPTSNGATVADGTVVWTGYEAQVFLNTERYNDAFEGWVMRIARNNSLTNYDFETDTTGWVLGSGWARSNAQAYTGSWSIASPANGSGAGTKTYKQDSEIINTVGKTYSFSTYVKSDTPNQARISATVDASLITPAIADGTFTAGGAITAGGQEITTYSPYHPGDGTWKKLEVTRIITYPHPKPSVAFHKEIATGQAYFDKCNYNSNDLLGTYTSPVYDRGSSLTRRAWPQFDVVFVGTGTAWWDQFSATALWTSKFSGADTWIKLFGAYIAGILKMKIGYSTNGTTWSWIDYFESYVAETQARYVKYQVTIEDKEVDGFLYLKPTTYKEAYWQ